MLKIEFNETVQFLSPGTLFSEISEKKCQFGDVHHALEIQRTITAPHGAKPYGFKFIRYKSKVVDDGEGHRAVKDSKPDNESGIHFITGTVLRFDEVEKMSGMSICLENMRCNNWPFVVQNRNSFLSTLPFETTDCVIELDGNISERGDDPARLEYATLFAAEREAYYASR